MKINFKLDAAYDEEVAIEMLKGPTWVYRAGNMGITSELAKKLHESEGTSLIAAKAEFHTIVVATYNEFGSLIDQARVNYQASWDKIISEFSQTVEELTVPWYYPEYIVNVTYFNRGISNWNGNVVGRWWKEDADQQRRITAHEILLAHFFSIHRNRYSTSGLTDQKVWELAEIFAFAMTGLEPKLTKFWPWDTSGYYTNHNYPQLVDLQNRLKEPFISRISFDEYVKKGISLQV
jgi:hypothetical protein